MAATSHAHTTTIPVRWSDFDRFGHVMNANYVEFAQEARLVFAQEHFYSKGVEFNVFVRSINADFRLPVGPDTTEVTVHTDVSEVGTTSFVTRQEILDRQGRIACVVECAQVVMDLETMRPRPLTEQEVELITAPSRAAKAAE
ncbi:acyl-CoA thioesterase [Corynebacterium tapiri]|uniref:Acyl-CoA thioesterase n=1 Tax=Corynebacterium tapiri TaxID=1448266 RepID=A0A5C4U1I6_9CORY|nr:thioesterase family protein [Corynebacterium tapiri]TNL94872.1 acyl-CoA thioesterase [Corynebacterium tapiri]